MGKKRKLASKANVDRAASERKVDRAIERLIAAWEDYKAGGNSDELTNALDALTVSHVIATFEMASGINQAVE